MAESTSPKANELAVPKNGAKTIPVCTFGEMLENAPLHSARRVTFLFSQPEFGNIALPEDIRVHCDNPKCDGTRRHWKHKDSKFQFDEEWFYFHAVYVCSDCKTHVKIFTLKVQREGVKQYSGVCTKIYQDPPFGAPIPKRLFYVVGEANRESFLQARRAIARGLGIGAYAYYRRIVENKKFDLIRSILEIAQATNASEKQIELLKRAQSETQFTKAIENLRDVSAIPSVLLIDGHNPLLLLHDLLSEGIHQLSDQECLERAQEAEIILSEIAERMQIALTERKQVKAAVSSILNRKSRGANSE